MHDDPNAEITDEMRITAQIFLKSAVDVSKKEHVKSGDRFFMRLHLEDLHGSYQALLRSMMAQAAEFGLRIVEDVDYGKDFDELSYQVIKLFFVKI